MTRPRGVAAFVRARRAGWERLDALVERVDGGRLDGGARWRSSTGSTGRTIGDLAHARTAFPGTDAEGYLAQLAARAFAALQRGRRGGWRSALGLLRSEGPAEVVRHRGALALAAALLAGRPGGRGAGAPRSTRRAGAGCSRCSVREALAAKRLWTDDLLTAAPGLAGGAIARNNLSVAALCFALGLTGGLGTALLLVGNGALLGAVLVAAWRAGLGAGLAGFVAAHGPVELSALVLAGQAGFVLAGGLVRPGEWPRREALARRGREAARILVLVAPLLLLVAAVEATVSPAGRFPLAGAGGARPRPGGGGLDLPLAGRPGRGGAAAWRHAQAPEPGAPAGAPGPPAAAPSRAGRTSGRRAPGRWPSAGPRGWPWGGWPGRPAGSARPRGGRRPGRGRPRRTGRSRSARRAGTGSSGPGSRRSTSWSSSPGSGCTRPIPSGTVISPDRDRSRNPPGSFGDPRGAGQPALGA